MDSFLFLFDCELHLCDFILKRIPCFEREATSTSTASIDRVARQYPLFSCPGYHRSIESMPVLLWYMESHTILPYRKVYEGISTFLYPDLMTSTASISHDTRYSSDVAFFPRCDGFGVEFDHKWGEKYFIQIVFPRIYRTSWYVHTLFLFFIIRHPFCSRILGMDFRSHACMSSSPVRRLGFTRDTSVI